MKLICIVKRCVALCRSHAHMLPGLHQRLLRCVACCTHVEFVASANVSDPKTNMEPSDVVMASRLSA